MLHIKETIKAIYSMYKDKNFDINIVAVWTAIEY